MKIALAQINPTIGDLDGNIDLIEDAVRVAAGQGAGLVVLPEMALTGYPPRDLLDYPPFLADCAAALTALAGRVAAPCLVGHPAPNPDPAGKALFNAASLIGPGTTPFTYHKQLLPTYDVFDESRYFAPGATPGLLELGGRRIGVTICEDLWNTPDVLPRPYAVDPARALAERGVDLLVNLSAGPWQVGRRVTRRQLFAGTARAVGCPLAFCNQVGGNDELVFDGASMLLDGEGRVRRLSPSFRSDVSVVDLDAMPPPTDVPAMPLAAELLDALTLGLADYARKTGFERALVGVSGGIDSAVTAAIAARALGGDRLTCVAMPSRYSSAGSLSDARVLTEALEAVYHEVPIEPMFSAYLAALEEPFAGASPGVAAETLQARIRGALLMAISNQQGPLLLTTGNKSELAVGYCTLYGDMCGGLAILSDVPKTLVYALADEINREAGRPLIPEATISKPPSAELRPDQTDQDTLPPYDVLDGILTAYLEEGRSVAEIVAAGHDEATVRWVIERVVRNEYKRAQMPPGIRATSKAFGLGRRWPIAHGYR